MVEEQEELETICEYHEDFTQVRKKGGLRFGQIKKREATDAWTIATLEAPIQKLFKKLTYKNVDEMVIYGNGRPSNNGQIPLAGLIALLDRPVVERNKDWDKALQPYEQHISKVLDIDIITVRDGLQKLKIDLTMPHPEAIAANNEKFTAVVIKRIWGVSLSTEATERVYKVLFSRVDMASIKAKQPRIEKQITLKSAVELLRGALQNEGLLAQSNEMLLDTQRKLKNGNLVEYLPQVLQIRMDALQTKHEMDLTSTQWQNLRDDISLAWENFETMHKGIIGKKLWTGIRQLLAEQGKQWKESLNTEAFGPNFAEGVFFDMMAICEVDIKS